ncbi:hypothetical protein [uncultured Corynebacterium sp.]|uniref:hypothetical protein n=1 Tax=uncultured Corynebacterium sp. TaxID=159447 RepID=UPI0018DA15DB|nr:hypothetical protein [uncultured Corynebacterium sp.]
MSSVATSPATATISDVSFATPDRKNSPHTAAISPETRERARRARAAYTRRGRGGRDWEKSAFTRAQIIFGAGHKPARNMGRWWRAFRDHPKLKRLNRRGRASLLRFAKELQAKANQKTMSIGGKTWAWFAAQLGVDERTIGRWLETIRAMGMLVTIASGRSARWTPKDEEERNWTAVYAFSVPDSAYRIFSQAPPESFATPHPFRDGSASWVKTGTQKISYHTMCARAYARYARKHRGTLEAKRQQLTTGHGNKAEDTQLKHLARCLQHHSPADLRRIALKPLLAETTRFFRAGWQVADILHALETRSDGSDWETSGADGMRSVQAWLRLRLKEWLKDSQPMTAPSRIKSQAEAARKAEQARQQAQADAERRQRVSAAKDSPARVAVRRKAAIIRCGGEQAARHQHPGLFETA